MTYDYHGTWDDVTGLNSPLYARDSEPFNETKSNDWKNANFSINYWIRNGCPPEKINFGLAAYGIIRLLTRHICADVLGDVKMTRFYQKVVFNL